MAEKKKSLSGDNWLRAFYQLCGLDSARAEIAIARRYERSTASVNRLKRAARQKAKPHCNFRNSRSVTVLGTLSPARRFMAA
jgi:hypothetical protein